MLLIWNFSKKTKIYDFVLLALWRQRLEKRSIYNSLSPPKEKQGWTFFKYAKTPVIKSKPNWEVAFHGSWWYALWLILETGVFLESNDPSLGHDFWEPGVYCSPNVETGRWYARPQILFEDGVYHRVLFELRVDSTHRKRAREKGGTQWIFPSNAVSLYAVWVENNSPPRVGEERLDSWDPALEALPSGRHRPEPIVNPHACAHSGPLKSTQCNTTICHYYRYILQYHVNTCKQCMYVIKLKFTLTFD